MKKFINNYKKTMLAQYLVSQGATDLRKSMKRSVEAVHSPQVNKERAFHIHLSVESFCIVFQKCILREGFRLCFVLKLLLIFDQISGSFSCKIVLIK